MCEEVKAPPDLDAAAETSGTLKPPDLNVPAERPCVRWDYSSQNPSGAAVSLPLSGRVGVHHAGRVHPGANSQRLLLHAGRGPAGQVVLDPEHLRGPDAATVTAARPRERRKTWTNQEEEEKSAALRDRRRLDLLEGRRFVEVQRPAAARRKRTTKMSREFIQLFIWFLDLIQLHSGRKRRRVLI